MDDYQSFATFAKETVLGAMEILKDHQGHIQVANQKDSVDVATDADLASEKFIMDRIHTAYPDHGIHSEEAGDSLPDAEFRWIIDPLDSTKEYVRGLEEFAVLLALERHGELIVGAIAGFPLGTVYHAWKGGGAYKNDVRINVADTADLGHSFMATHIPNGHTNSAQTIDQALALVKQLNAMCYRCRINWVTAKLCVWVAQGGIDGMILPECAVHWHDIAPGLLIASEAGAKISDWYGDAPKLGSTDKGFIVASDALYSPLWEIAMTLRTHTP
jgi:myo-inositol-1(or 4)-monophosphatase